jgi:radical SAM superfamily enzyme YgiQ (UPF0313 family)|tara:strand:+ start:457 stop:1887 length:1431 start_codon:yes stop_codon:yes gene_type:complete
MKILFTNSPLHYSHGHTFTQPDWQTLVLPTLAGIIREENHDILLIDNMTGLFRSNSIIKGIKDFGPDIIGFSIIAARDIFNTVKIINQVSQEFPNIILIAGGQGASFYDKMLLDAGVDFVVRGEGELTLRELIKAINEKTENFSYIKGISFLNGDEIIKNEDRLRIATLDESPLPAIDLMPLRKSRWFPGRFTGSIETSRGCPFTCNFCAITSFWEGSFRRKSVDRIIEEMKILSKFNRTHIYMADDNFGMGANHHINLFERILKEGLDVRFFAQMRTDTIAKHPDMVALAAKAGLYGALIGFDTYDEDTFHHISKQGGYELNIRCSELLRKNNIMIFGTHIYGLPSQKKVFDFSGTYWSGRKNSDLFRMPHFSLLPGTEQYNKMASLEVLEASKKGYSGKDNEDYRLLIRPAKEKKKFKRGYTFFTLLNMLLPDEILKTIFSKNRNVRIIKKYGYISTFRFYFYRVLRFIRLTDI